MNSSVKLEVKTALIKYINKHQQKDVNNTMGDFLKRCQDITFEVFYCPVYINMDLLEEISHFVAEFLTANPLVTQDILCDIIKVLLKNNYHATLETNQIIIQIVIQDHKKLVGGHHCLVSIRGILSEYTYFKKTFTRASVWSCPSGCPIEILKFLPKTEFIKCLECDNYMIEIDAYRKYGTRVEGQLVLRRQDWHLNRYTCTKWVEFLAEDGRISDLQLGAEYIVTGRWLEQGEQFEVWGFHKIDSIIEWPLTSCSKIEEIREKIQSNKLDPFAFVRLLSFRMGGETHGPQNFPNFRTYLLLSLASVKSDYPIPVLAICREEEDENSCLELMLESMDYAERGVRFSYPFKRFGVEYLWAAGLLKGGALTLSHEGVCFIGDLERYPDKIFQAIRTSLGKGRFTIPVQGLHDMFIDFKCALWSVNLFKQGGTVGKVLPMLQRCFGFIWGQEGINEIEENLICNPMDIPKEDLKGYLASINKIKVELKKDVVILIKRYLAVCHRRRGNIFPPTIFDIMRSLTEAHARLEQKNEARPENVLFVIRLMETTIDPLQIVPNNFTDFKEWFEKVFGILVTKR